MALFDPYSIEINPPEQPFISGASAVDMANSEMNFNHNEAQLNREWQEHMRDTALSSAFRQARENGINPYVMFNGGAVSSPSGSTASYSGYASSERSARASEANSARQVSSNERVAILNGLFKAFTAFSLATIFA